MATKEYPSGILKEIGNEVEQLAARRRIGACRGAFLKFGDAELADGHRVSQDLRNCGALRISAFNVAWFHGFTLRGTA
ncbi:hypothetical protein GCM10009604_03810 [Corynebacterium aurimucosum]